MFATYLTSFLLTALPIVHGVPDWQHSGEDWTGTCATGLAQSPVGLDSTTCHRTPLSKELSILIKWIPKGVLGKASGVQLVDDKGELELRWTSWTNEDVLSKLVKRYGIKIRQVYNETFGTPLNLHFHVNSEHALDGNIYAAEGHLVRQLTTSCGDAGACKGVFGVFYKLPKSPYSEATLPALKDLLDRIQLTQIADGSALTVNLPADYVLDFAKFFPETISSRPVYQYAGSLTTPPCSEIISWTVFKSAMIIDVPELIKLMDIDTDEIKQRTNNRPPQKLNGRTITCGTLA